MPYAYGATITHEFDGTKLNIWLTFRFPMNQDNKPALANWTLTVDTVDKAISDSDWIDEFTLWLESVATVTYPTRVLLAYTGTDENLETTWGKNWEPWGDTLSTDVGQGIHFVDRGDPVGNDFTIVDFTQDNTWRDLDLTGVVPAANSGVLLRIRARSTASGERMAFRTNGNSNTTNVARCYTQVANIEIVNDAIIILDENLKFEYKGRFGTFNIFVITVAGWWI